MYLNWHCSKLYFLVNVVSAMYPCITCKNCCLCREIANIFYLRLTENIIRRNEYSLLAMGWLMVPTLSKMCKYYA